MLIMKKFLIQIILLFGPLALWAAPNYDKYFTNEVLRVDYLLTGNATSTSIMPNALIKEYAWGGSHKSLFNQFNLGTYQFEVFDSESGKLIFSKGFSPLFQEWQATPEAKSTNKAFYQVLRFPFPKKNIKLSIQKRDRSGLFVEIYTQVINPENYFIIRENPRNIPVEKILYSGEPEHKIDIAILAEGYTADEMDKFIGDAKRLTDSLFVANPFSQLKDKFNIYAIKTPSVESGTDIPGEHIYRNTLFNTTFFTFDISRYLTTSDLKAVSDMASVVPYDQIMILVNSSRYGGGGFYNFINVCTSDHLLSPNVFVHEFGHGFVGLADEYYTSEVAFQDYYNLKVEPWEPNLTTLVNFKSKWDDLVNKSTAIPTPREKDQENVVGAFEGGGYSAKGIYSPMQDCRMKSNKTLLFCPVCTRAIQEVISSQTK